MCPAVARFWWPISPFPPDSGPYCRPRAMALRDRETTLDTTVLDDAPTHTSTHDHHAPSSSTSRATMRLRDTHAQLAPSRGRKRIRKAAECILVPSRTLLGSWHRVRCTLR